MERELPGTEVAFERDVFEYDFLLPNRKLGEKVARFRQIKNTSVAVPDAGVCRVE
jgi:hypothetical protein